MYLGFLQKSPIQITRQNCRINSVLQEGLANRVASALLTVQLRQLCLLIGTPMCQHSGSWVSFGFHALKQRQNIGFSCVWIEFELNCCCVRFDF